VGKMGRIATLENAYTQAEEFYFGKEEARICALDMQNFIHKNWEKIFKETGIGNSDIEIIASCIYKNEK